MCDAIRVPLSEFTAGQVERFQLAGHVSEDADGEAVVTFRRRTMPFLIPYYRHGQLQLTAWTDYVKTTDISNAAMYHGNRIQKPKYVTVPAKTACQNGVWFTVAPRQICGILKPTQECPVSILVKPASDYYERMTHYGWEPVCTGERDDPAADHGEYE